jgi:hypothetical protein
VQAHIAPRLALVCDAVTTGFYQPIKKQQGDPEWDQYEVKADVSGLVQRPNRLADASQLHAVSAIGDKALREAGGFEEEDAPTTDERAIAVAIQVATQNPQLLDNMPDIVKAVKALYDGTPATGPGQVQSQREPGTLTPLVPSNVTPPAPVVPNGLPARGEARPLAEQDTLPQAGSPV